MYTDGTLVGVDDPAVVELYDGMNIFVFHKNGECQNHISVHPIGDRNSAIAIDGGFIYKPIDNRLIVFAEDQGPSAPIQTPVYGKNLLGSVCRHINDNYEHYLGDRTVDELSPQDKTLIWLRAVNTHLFTQFRTPTMRALPPPPAGSRWKRKHAEIDSIDLYFPWDLEARHIFDFLRMPTYTNESISKVVDSILGDSAVLLYQIGKNLFNNSSSRTDVSVLRAAATVGKVVYLFQHGLNSLVRCNRTYWSDVSKKSIQITPLFLPTYAPRFDSWDTVLWHVKAREVIKLRVAELLLLREQESKCEGHLRSERNRLRREKYAARRAATAANGGV